MFKILKLGRFKKGIITTKYPNEPYRPGENYKGMPVVDPAHCNKVGACAKVCPTGAINVTSTEVIIDIGSCIFCGACEKACPHNAIKLSQKFELSTKVKEHLKVAF